MLIINNSIIPFGKSYLAINIFGVVFTKGHMSQVCIRHERIHTAQQKELLFVGFYIIYIIEWFVRLLMYRNLDKAYLSISFEREAYMNQHKEDYLKTRKPYSWRRYYKTKTHNP